MTAIRFPCLLFRIWFSSVVFPEPRKPVNNVTGIGELFRLFIVKLNSSKTLTKTLIYFIDLGVH